jgi:DNA helicase-2/ATP-dependent DNA helicase PcrA
MQRLFVSRAWSRNMFGSSNYNPPSRFLKEVPSSLVTEARKRTRPSKLDSSRSRPTIKASELSPGDRVRHAKWGEGTIQRVAGVEAVVEFAGIGTKHLHLELAPLEKVPDLR